MHMYQRSPRPRRQQFDQRGFVRPGSNHNVTGAGERFGNLRRQAKMPYRKFVVYNVAGGALWVASMIWLGYVFGSKVENLEIFFTALVLLMVGASVLPGAWHLLRQRRAGGAQT